MKQQKIFIDYPMNVIPDREQLQKCAPSAELIYREKGKKIPLSEWLTFDAVIGIPLDPVDLKNLLHLKWVQLLSAGADLYTKPGVLPENTLLTCATGAYGNSMSEYMICTVLNLMMDFPYYRDNQKKHIWKKSNHIRHIEGSTVLIIGLGNIGSEFAKRYKALGGTVIGVKRTMVTDKPDYVNELYTVEKLDKLIPRADVVVLCLPSTKDTNKIFGKQKIELMKKTSFLINVGRGSAVDTNALSDALYAEKIAGAALDVTDPEPLPSDHPIWDAPNTVITPHISGGWEVPENTKRVLAIVYENLRRYEKGQPLINIVDRKTGYRTH